LINFEAISALSNAYNATPHQGLALDPPAKAAPWTPPVKVQWILLFPILMPEELQVNTKSSTQ